MKRVAKSTKPSEGGATPRARGLSALRASEERHQLLLAVVTHELRTPLMPALVAVEALGEVDMPAEGRALLAIIRRNIERESRLIDDLLDHTRLAHGKLELRRETVDVHALVAEALGICAADLADKAIDVRCALGAGQRHVSGDPARLAQVLWNLLKNATKFTPVRGTITVRSALEGGRIAVSIADSGIGIAPAALSSIFDAFAQGERSVARRFGGLGLGLTISRALVEAHDGELAATSDGPGRGATFTLRLPVVGAPDGRARAPTPLPPAPGEGTGARILLVDDHEDTTTLVARMLTRSGHSIRAASSVASAWQAAEEERFDLLISDIGLPDGSGLELLRRMRERGPMKAIAVSGYGTPEDARRSHEAGFALHLVKPLSARALTLAIDEVLRGGSGRPPAQPV